MDVFVYKIETIYQQMIWLDLMAFHVSKLLWQLDFYDIVYQSVNNYDKVTNGEHKICVVLHFYMCSKTL